jgi:hypothetical protein
MSIDLKLRRDPVHAGARGEPAGDLFPNLWRYAGSVDPRPSGLRPCHPGLRPLAYAFQRIIERWHYKQRQQRGQYQAADHGAEAPDTDQALLRRRNSVGNQ